MLPAIHAPFPALSAQRAAEHHARRADAAAQMGDMETAIALNTMANLLMTAACFYTAADHYAAAQDVRMADYCTERANAQYLEALQRSNVSGVVH